MDRNLWIGIKKFLLICYYLCIVFAALVSLEVIWKDIVHLYGNSKGFDLYTIAIQVGLIGLWCYGLDVIGKRMFGEW